MHDIIKFAVEQIACGNENVGPGGADFFQQISQPIFANDDSNMHIGDLDNPQFSSVRESVICGKRQVPHAQMLCVKITVDDQSGCDHYGQIESGGLKSQSCRIRDKKFVDDADALSGNTQKEEKKDKGHPNVADISQRPCQALPVE